MTTPDGYDAFIEARREIRQLSERERHLWHALNDCISYVDVDNLTMQHKYTMWKHVLDGGGWNRGNVKVVMPDGSTK